MVNYTVKILNDIPEDMKRESATPAAHHLFDISDDATKLPKTDADLFHQFVAQLFYLSNIARTYIHLAVSVLLTIFRDPDTYDYKNLSRVMKYIQGTIGLPLILQGILSWDLMDRNFNCSLPSKVNGKCVYRGKFRKHV